MLLHRLLLPFMCLLASLPLSAQTWQAADNPLMTSWGEAVTPENAWTEYPRPMMVRENWQSLNGLWDFALTGKSGTPREYDRRILVPFPVESALSGIKEAVGPLKRAWYQRTFDVEAEAGERVLLHFGAVDWEAHVFVNDQLVGSHQGGYDPFSFDITPYVSEDGPQKLEVTAWDPTDHGKQPVGKQTAEPRGIWYTAVTGIWQSVWLEVVPETYIQGLSITPELDERRFKLDVAAAYASEGHQLVVTALADGEPVAQTRGGAINPLYLYLEAPRLWSPDDPFLYDLSIQLLNEDGEVVDEVQSYAGMRKISLGKDEDGFNRLFLNNEPLFQLGPLDQGWWPDGLYTAPSDEALKYDVEITKKMGFNMLRKHVKVEPQRFYYWCDKIGLLVWQDMPSGDMKPRKIKDRSEASAANFRQEYQAMIDAFYNHPSIVMWVPFNEGWGQFQTEAITRWTMAYDPSRLVNNASGWTDKGVGDVMDMHRYPGPAMPEPEPNRAVVLGEFGGQALAIRDHLWVQDFSKAPTHFKTSESTKALHEQYQKLMEALYPLKDKGLAAAVYTQTTDVESEVNGYLTYDRKVVKYDEAMLKRLHEKLYE